MRGHKYRVWSKELQKMVYFTLGQLLHSYNDEGDYPSIDGTDLFSIHQDINPDEAMQFTGIKDKNKQDIYVGDIVRGEHQDTTVVEWEQNIDTDRDWCFASGFEINLLNTSVNVLVGGSDFQHHLLNVEVIGNIYENPNLLEASQ